jgi:SurA N-terminal domain
VGSQSISGSLFRHWAGVAKRAEGRRAKARATIEQVMNFLISSDWVIDEAQSLNVQVSDPEVRRRFDHIRRQQFPKPREFSAFLKSSGQTVADLLFRVRLNLLTMRVQGRIVAGHSGASAEEALARFAREFKTKWSGQTYCSPAYAVADCGHVQGAL